MDHPSGIAVEGRGPNGGGLRTAKGMAYVQLTQLFVSLRVRRSNDL
jgi:hypothetical protein